MELDKAPRRPLICSGVPETVSDLRGAFLGLLGASGGLIRLWVAVGFYGWLWVFMRFSVFYKYFMFCLYFVGQ